MVAVSVVWLSKRSVLVTMLLLVGGTGVDFLGGVLPVLVLVIM